ncbi:MAG: zinc ABC transporter substrate-binding protein [Alphaproteobacteria bacterium]|nr:zinc ABC transporter substrate-binding protein [Alphaproteobacteria bacterium]
MKRIFLFFMAVFISFPAFAANKIVATYPPIQSLVWAVTEGVTPVNLMFVKQQESHHDVQLKPSQMKTLQGADIIFYASDDLETFMKDAVAAVAPKAKVFSLANEIPNLTLLPTTLDPEKKDMHYWLDYRNALLMIDKIAEIMIQLDPKNEKKYLANREKARTRIDSLKFFERPEETKKFLAFHDGFGYMADSLDLNIKTADYDIENINTPKLLNQIKQQIDQEQADCYLVDPHIPSRHLRSLGLKGNNVIKTDAFGWNITGGVGQYYLMMRWNLDRLVKCKAKK